MMRLLFYHLGMDSVRLEGTVPGLPGRAPSAVLRQAAFPRVLEYQGDPTIRFPHSHPWIC